MSATKALRVIDRRTRLRRRPVLAISVVVVLAVALLLAALLPSSHRAHASAAELTRYENAIIGPVKDWGSVEILGMRPSVGDLLGAKGALPPSAVVAESKAWLAAFAHDRELIAAVHPPVGLGPCRALMLRALDKYSEAARTFGRAAETPLAQRRPIVEEGVASASAGDKLFDRASTLLQQARREAGLPPTTNFPNPQPTASVG